MNIDGQKAIFVVSMVFLYVAMSITAGLLTNTDPSVGFAQNIALEVVVFLTALLTIVVPIVYYEKITEKLRKFLHEMVETHTDTKPGLKIIGAMLVRFFPIYLWYFVSTMAFLLLFSASFDRLPKETVVIIPAVFLILQFCYRLGKQKKELHFFATHTASILISAAIVGMINMFGSGTGGDPPFLLTAHLVLFTAILDFYYVK